METREPYGVVIKVVVPERGLLGKSVKELNAHMARLCAMFAKGENVTEVALVAPTDAMISFTAFSNSSGESGWGR